MGRPPKAPSFLIHSIMLLQQNASRPNGLECGLKQRIPEMDEAPVTGRKFIGWRCSKDIKIKVGT